MRFRSDFTGTSTGTWHGRAVGGLLQVSAVEDMPWGTHEFTLTHPSGNTIRIGRSTSEVAS